MAGRGNLNDSASLWNALGLSLLHTHTYPTTSSICLLHFIPINIIVHKYVMTIVF